MSAGAPPASSALELPAATRGRARPCAALERLLQGSLAFGFLVLTLDVLWGVFSRYVLGQQGRWTEELALYLLVWVSLLGASLAYSEGSHLGVDYLVQKLDPAARQLSKVLVELLVLGFSAFVLVRGGVALVSETLASGQVSPALGLRMGYVYLAVPLSGLCFAVFALEKLVLYGRELAWKQKS